MAAARKEQEVLLFIFLAVFCDEVLFRPCTLSMA
ncbi:hypothetical protein W822_03145 [Advenella kashmirensis W13003]|uniref:Uncharacterized protein n=1 Tax=Advenella kashmirensis W13003 TaxID=1424334 RepID=V8QXR1_9BURK|nr:hypothetical protein W822_03145 [Advenella kashmirensis W13003]